MEQLSQGNSSIGTRTATRDLPISRSTIQRFLTKDLNVFLYKTQELELRKLIQKRWKSSRTRYLYQGGSGRRVVQRSRNKM